MALRAIPVLAGQIIELVEDNADVTEIFEIIEAIEYIVIVDIIKNMYADDLETLKGDLAKLALVGNGKNVPKKSMEYILWHLTTKYFDGDSALLLDTIEATKKTSMRY